MGTDRVTQKIASQLHQVLANMNGDLDRVEILTAALAGFSRPIPDYEPTFHHLNAAPLPEHEIRSGRR
jgi:hypothetical protein